MDNLRISDMLLRYHITPEEISRAYMEKRNQNMRRNYDKESREKYEVCATAPFL